MAQLQQIAESPGSRASVLLGGVDSSLRDKPTLWISALLLAGFLVRLWHATGTFLNPDEALHFQMANTTSWALAYRASLTLAHPPLLVLLLHAWGSMGKSEVFLRLPSILAGTAFCWLTYRWLRMLFSESVAWIAFIFVLFLPTAIGLSSEVRQYSLLLAFAMGSAYLLERALATESAGAMLASSVCLWFAILSHYSSFLFAAALGIYALVRMVRNRPSLKLFAVWELGQIVALAICYFLYVTQLASLRYSGASAGQGWISYLDRSYFNPARDNPLLFVLGRTGGVFQYIFGQSVVGDLAYPLFVIGVVLIFRERFLEARALSRMQLGALLLLPFLLNCVAAMVRMYPYGGTRHTAFLLPFAVAGVGVSLAHFLKDRPAWGVISALLISLLCNVFPTQRAPHMSRGDQSRGNMQAALMFIHQQIPPGEPIFTDYQSSLLLNHYLCEQKPLSIAHAVPGFLAFECGGHRVIAADWNTFLFSSRSFYDQWQSMVSQYNLAPGSKVWVTQMGWSTHLGQQLQNFPELGFTPHFFGNRIQVFALTVGQRMPDPRLLPSS